MKQFFQRVKAWIRSLSYRTGIYLGVACVVCYIISFAQMLLPVSIAAKGVIWFIFFGLAKAAQYSALLILGKAGVVSIFKRLRKKQH